MANSEHVFISDEPLTVGKMSHNEKYKFFSALCVALDTPERGTHEWEKARATLRILWRCELSVKAHWHTLVRPVCDRCCLLQAILRANVKKADRLTYDRDQFRSLIQKIETESQREA